MTGTSVSPAWIAHADNEDGVQVERSTDRLSYQRMSEPGRNTTVFTDAAVTGGQTYRYRVRAFNRQKNPDWSNVLPLTTTPGDHADHSAVEPDRHSEWG